MRIARVLDKLTAAGMTAGCVSVLAMASSALAADAGVSLIDMKAIADLGLGVGLAFFVGYLLWSVLRDVRQFLTQLIAVVDRNTAAMSAMTEIVRSCHDSRFTTTDPHR